MIAIEPGRITEIRKARGIGRPKLAKMASLTERQISRLEGALPMKGEFTQDMLLRLAAALHVRPEVLTDTGPLTDADFDAVPQGKSCGCC
ncbi:helix-turn-helix transcriptional regulator [Paracoccus sp. Z330]|uniref:Helix-turn-helix transcriptional regulator n=1 Tax=Paracoccus onchidii TaxID=3017813 RepID=A0ABT4ZGL1_9RHOB|nr:helix-turn-helix transcriptional regulator [Paracoccus onchidii]MDB6178232.1 helix-turn-helix transcriptional regulator [Paracoccus onchidii]